MRQIVPINRRLGYVMLLLLTACSPAPEGLMTLHDYQSRIANTLGREPIRYQPQVRLLPPPERELRVNVPPLTISLLDSMRLDACAAGPLIAERNSALGRLQNGVLRYFHDRQLSAALTLCAAQLADSNPQLAAQVSALSSAKQAQLPQLRTQAIVHDTTIRALMSMADRPLSTADSATLAPLLGALQVIIQTLDAQAQLPNEEELIKALELLENDRYISQLWRALHDNHNYLSQLAPLTQNLSQAAGCKSVGVPQRAQVLRQIFISRFSGPVQRHLSALTFQAQQLEPYLAELMTPLAKWRSHLQQLLALDDQLKLTTRNHVQPWQQLFSDCQFTPGR